jgi:arylformamidase
VIYDISRTIAPSTTVWPSDSPFAFDVISRRDKNAGVNLTTLHMSAHTGTHADAPWHYDNAGAHPADLLLDRYLGSAHVVTITRQHGGIIPADFDERDLAGMQRLLIHTWVSDLSDDQWPDDFPYPTPELIDWLADFGAVLLGVDMPSVDRFDDAELLCHHRLYANGINNLESLRLAGVPDGSYELVALPLKIADVCGSPVRAILRTIE